jgi:putrescine transport system permease protein
MRPNGHRWENAALWIPFCWVIAFVLAPLVLVLKISLADPVLAQPPFTPLLEGTPEGEWRLRVTLDNYRYLFSDGLYPLAYLYSLALAAGATVGCVLLGLPMAYCMARAAPSTRRTLLLLVIVPFWVSLLLRVYAWMGILGTAGPLNGALLALGLIDRPLALLYTDAAVVVGMVYVYLPFMVLPLFAVLERLDADQLAAAADLGARPWQVFTDVVLPFARPGLAAGCLLVFVPAIGEFVVPALLGDADVLMVGRMLYEEFFFNRDWPAAAAVTAVLLLVLALPFALLQRVARPTRR